MLALLAASGDADFQFELVDAGEAFRRAIDGDEDRHFGSQALLEICGLEHAALDADGSVRRRRNQPDRRQRAGSAIRLNIGVDGDAAAGVRARAGPGVPSNALLAKTSKIFASVM